MNQTQQSPAPGLYLVATPIGAARDITLRALDILAAADVIAAEDTRSLRRLMDIHGLALGGRPLIAYHDHNGAQVRPRLLRALAAGKSVAYAPEAGTPMISDPGFVLARAAAAEGHAVTAAPGPAAVIAALTLSGLPTDRFFFAGFPPAAAGRRKSALAELARVPGTLVFYESPRRAAAMLRDAARALGGDRPAALCRELTKKFEEIRRGTLDELASSVAGQPLKGEIVIVIGAAPERPVNDSDLDSALSETLKTQSVRDAADTVSARLGLPRRQVYQRALQRAKER